MKTCATCGGLLPIRSRSRTCSSACSAKLYRVEHPKPPRSYTCAACGVIVTVRGSARGRRLCGDCRDVGPSVAKVLLRRSEESYVCANCQSAFTRAPTKGQRPRWCSKCSDGRGWARRNRAIRNLNDQRRRARLAGGETEQFTSLEIYERDQWRCGVCRRRVHGHLVAPHPGAPSIDHIIPISQGGHHVRSNVRLTHLRCNISRGNRGGGEQLLLIG